MIWVEYVEAALVAQADRCSHRSEAKMISTDSQALLSVLGYTAGGQLNKAKKALEAIEHEG